MLFRSGLAAGEVVVTAGVHALTEGQKVRLYTEPGAVAAAAAAVVPQTQPQTLPQTQPQAQPQPQPAVASR